MQQIADLVAHYGLALVFLNVFVQQAGAPVPALPTLIVAGALVGLGSISLPALITVAILASLAGDLIWYTAGRIYGMRVLRLLCRVSISPDSCVRGTEERFQRWGPVSLVIAKFLPGFSTVAPPLAGALRLAVPAFVLYSIASAALWSGVGVGFGLAFHHQIDSVLVEMQQMGVYAVVAVGAALAMFIAVKWRERRRFFAELRMARITADALNELIRDGHNPVIADVRAAADRDADPRRIPGAIALDPHMLDAGLAGLSPEQEIVLYCT